MKLLTRVLFLILIISFFTVGCGKSGKTEIVFFETLTSANRTELLKKLITDYETANPNITINLISPPYEQAENKLFQMLNAKQTLDVIESRDATLKQLVNNKQVISLESFIDKWEYSKDFLPSAIESARFIDNTAYILPYLFFTKGMYVRTDILKENNIAVPTTIEEFMAACAKLTNPVKNRFGHAMRGKINAFKVSGDYLRLSQVSNIDPSKFYWTTDGTFAYSTKEGKDSLKAFKDLYVNGTPNDAVNWGFAEQVNAFTSGVCSFLIQDPDAMPMIDETLGEGQYDVIPIPLGKTGHAYQDLAFQGLSIVSYSKQQDEAWKFMSYLVEPKQNAEFCKLYGAIPVHNSVFDEDPFFKSPKFNAWRVMFSTPEKYVFAKYPLDSDKFAGWNAFSEQTTQKYLLGEATLEDTVKQWEDYWK